MNSQDNCIIAMCHRFLIFTFPFLLPPLYFISWKFNLSYLSHQLLKQSRVLEYDEKAINCHQPDLPSQAASFLTQHREVNLLTLCSGTQYDNYCWATALVMLLLLGRWWELGELKTTKAVWWSFLLKQNKNQTNQPTHKQNNTTTTTQWLSVQGSNTKPI